jgi:hypothetical protein
MAGEERVLIDGIVTLKSNFNVGLDEKMNERMYEQSNARIKYTYPSLLCLRKRNVLRI